eukprot:TRINITY_DN18_c0_g1_i9.p1 TRINITY_DN18_c0_g1~~TRINITY_DN18_c0_g1_i9.p1  ORF type:complete len:171 (+),score=7.70 TRINITY_DN18_c0_g1_i9:3890-4402(+)
MCSVRLQTRKERENARERRSSLTKHDLHHRCQLTRNHAIYGTELGNQCGSTKHPPTQEFATSFQEGSNEFHPWCKGCVGHEGVSSFGSCMAKKATNSETITFLDYIPCIYIEYRHISTVFRTTGICIEPSFMFCESVKTTANTLYDIFPLIQIDDMKLVSIIKHPCSLSR